jgi:hypothetical protein
MDRPGIDLLRFRTIEEQERRDTILQAAQPVGEGEKLHSGIRVDSTVIGKE